MELLRDVESLPAHERVVAVGTFDGVHVGHQRVIRTAVEAAHRRGLTAAVLTFDHHPLAVVAPEREPRTLTTFADKVELIADLGVDELIVLPFDIALANLDAGAFCTEVLERRLGARVVVVGRNFTFAAGGVGTAATLRACGRRQGFETVVVPLARAAAGPISSTRIRTLLDAGHLSEAREILGRPPHANGRVVRGFRRGTQLGYPTANVEVETGTLFPGRGVYAARARVRGRWYRAAVNVGHNPTFLHHGDEAGIVHVEAFLLGFDGDIYGTPIRLEFLARIRGEETFEYIDDLVSRMGVDVAETAALQDPAFAEAGI